MNKPDRTRCKPFRPQKNHSRWENAIINPETVMQISSYKHRWKVWLGAFAGATFLGLLAAIIWRLSPAYEKEGAAMVQVLAWQLTWWYTWLPVLPPAVHFIRRFPLDGGRWFRNLALHLPASLFFSLTHLTLYVYTAWYTGGAWRWLKEEKDVGGPGKMLLELIGSPSSVNYRTRILLYGALLVVLHAIDYYNRSKEEELKASQLEMRLAQAKLQALKMQLHPHFLFNTLHSISALLYKDIRAAEEMVARLMNFLELTLQDSGPQLVSLRKELEFLQCYLEIEKVRFQDRLTVRTQIDPLALDAQVPNLITQPIVENAIRHGISTQATPGQIEIIATSDQGTLRIRIRDNGPGFHKERTNGGKEGVGLTNTRARLQQIYGNAHRLDFVNAAEGGLEVILEIPHQKASTPSLLKEASL